MNNGIVGFFDILGYKTFLQNNTPAGAMRVVSKLAELETSLASEMQAAFSPRQPDRAADIAKLVKWLVVSDSILMYSEFDDAETDGQRSNRWIAAHFAAMLLWRRMFAFGLPLRGVIHTGEFVVAGTSFAGRAIVESYERSQNFDFAGYAYTEAAATAMKAQAEKMGDKDLIGRSLVCQSFEYLMPVKNGAPGRVLAANPLTLMLEDSESLLHGDIRQLVHEAFWKHNKDVAPSVQPKILNTEQYLRACRFAMNSIADREGAHMFKARFPADSVSVL